MGERIERLPDPGINYPWHEWCDGSKWRIRQGEDFHVTKICMASQLYQRATALGKKVTVRKSVRNEYIYFQFVERDK
jgi:hypothetical protein